MSILHLVLVPRQDTAEGGAGWTGTTEQGREVSSERGRDISSLVG